MKGKHKLSLTILILIIAYQHTFSQLELPRYIDSKDHAILLNVDIQTEHLSILLRWEKNDLAQKYYIYRKDFTSKNWGKPIATLEGDATSFIDTNVQTGVIYEYQIEGFNFGSLIFRAKDSKGEPYDSTGAVFFNSFGYVLAGIEIGPFDENGVVLLLLDETLNTPEFEEVINQYEYELMRDGWGIIRKYAPRAENFDRKKIAETKYLIAAEQEDDPKNLRTLILIGRIAVPYSGELAPDGHSDHLGAWPSDLYYGSFEEFLWTDFIVNNNKATRKENHNIPNDGKFDRSYLDNEAVEMQIGRIDFHNLPAFQFTEKELLKRYLEKNINYRRGNILIQYRGLVSDNFPARHYEEGFASSGWRNFASILGKEKVSAMNWPQTLSTEQYLWAYGCGSGYYNFADHIGNSDYMANSEVRAVFTMLLGSYFGDWDSQDNLLRAAIASSPSILTSCWAGRPHWYLHHMALGLPIGYSTRLTMNNFTLYKPYRYYFKGLDSLPSPEGKHKRGVHIALMGDPTLRMYINEVPSLNSIEITSNGYQTKIRWEANIDTNVKYIIYRANGGGKHFQRLMQKPQRINEFIDDNPIVGEQIYLVKPVKLLKTNSGMVYYTGRGAFQRFVFVNIADKEDIGFDFNANPLPAKNYITFRFSLPEAGETKIEIMDINGQIIKIIDLGILGATRHQFIWNFYNEVQSSGIYFAKIISGKYVHTLKIILIK